MAIVFAFLTVKIVVASLLLLLIAAFEERVGLFDGFIEVPFGDGLASFLKAESGSASWGHEFKEVFLFDGSFGFWFLFLWGFFGVVVVEGVSAIADAAGEGSV